MNILEILKNRYSCKKFDPTFQLTAEQIQQIKDLLRLSPSSINSQPWHFILATSKAGKEQIATATGRGVYSANTAKILDSSAVVIFCSKTDFSDEYLAGVLNKEEMDGRFANPEDKKNSLAGRGFYVNLHRDRNDSQGWMEKQVYLNLGNFLLGVAGLGLDAVPIEGIDTEVLNNEFQLLEKGYTAIVAAAVGKRSEDDFNAQLPKSRWEEETVITEI